MAKQASGWILTVSLVCASWTLQAVTIVKTNNVDNLNLNSSWVGGVTPKSYDIARWSNNVSSANAVLLGANLSYQGISILNPGGTVAIGGANTLTNGYQGINLSTATADLTLTNANLTLLEYANQVWNVTNSRTLTVSPSTLTRNSGSAVGIQGAGTVASATLTNDSTGIIGTWARYGTSTSTKFATVIGGVITGYTGTAAATAAGVIDTTGAINYEVAAAGTLGAGASLNTLRFTGPAGGLSGDFTASGLLNVGAGTLTLSNNVAIGANRELVLTSPDTTRTLVVSGAVNDNAGGASGVTVTGGGRVNLSGNSSYSGVTAVNAGSLAIYSPNALGTTNGSTVIYSTASATTGGQLILSGGLTSAEPVTVMGPGDGSPYSAAIFSAIGTNTLSGTVTLTGTTGYRIGGGGSAGSVLNLGLIQRSTSSGGTVTFDPTAGATLNVNAAMDNNGGNMTCHNGGTVVLNAANNDLGDTAVQNATTLKITATDALTTNRNLMLGQGTVVNTASGANNDVGTFYLEGSSQTVNALNGASNGVSSASYSDKRKITSTAAGAMTFTVGNGNATGYFDGVIENGTGVVSLVKVGTAVQTLAGNRANTYTGLTAVNGGTLTLSKLAGTNAISGNISIGAGTLVNGLSHQIADTASVTLTNAAAKWDLSSKAETVANVAVQNAGALANAGFVTGAGGKLTVTGTLTHALGDITLSSSGTGGTSWIDVNTLVNMGGGWTFGANDGSQVLLIGSGGLTMGGGSTIFMNASGTATNFISLTGDVTSQAHTLTNIISGLGQLRLNGTRVFNVADGVAPIDMAVSAILADGIGVGALTKTGSGTLNLSGINLYTGTTVINEGTLALSVTNALPGWDVNGRYVVASGAALAVGNAVSDAAIATMLGTGNFMAGASIGFDTTSGNRTNTSNLADTGAGALGVVKVGVNTLTLSGTNTYTGTTTVNSGVLFIPYTNALPGWDTNGRYSVYSNATLTVGNGVSNASVATMIATTNFLAGSNIGFDTSLGNRTYGNVISNTLNGALCVVKVGTNTLTFTGSNAYDGVTAVNLGILAINNANALGTTNGGTVIYSTGGPFTGGKLEVSGGITLAEPIILLGPGEGPPYVDSLVATGGTNTLTGTVTLTGTASYRIGAANAGTVLNVGLIQRTGATGNTLVLDPSAILNVNQPIINKAGDLLSHSGGMVVLNATGNDIGNTAVQYTSTLKLGAPDALATNKILTIGTVSSEISAERGTFNLAGFSQTVSALNGNGTNVFSTPATRMITNSVAGLSTLTVGNVNGSGAFNGLICGNIALTKVGTGTQTLFGTGTNTFSGDTTVYAGTLSVSNALALQKSTLNYVGGTVSFGGGLTAFTLGGLAGSQNMGLTNALGAVIALTVGNNNSDTVYSGSLSAGGSLVKVGSGKLTLAGVNTYAGSTTISNGTVALGCANALGSGTQIILSGGALDLGAYTNSLSALSITAAGGTLALGSGACALSFADSRAQTWSGTLNIAGSWGANSLRFGTNASGLTPTQLSSIRVNGQRAWVQLDAQGYLRIMTGTLLRVM